MTGVWSFIRQYLSESEAWLLLPVLAAVCMAVGSFFVLQSAVEKRSTVSDASKAEWKQKLLDEGKLVLERAKQKAEADAAAIQAHFHEQQQQTDSSSSQPPASDSDEAPVPASSDLRQRRGREAANQSRADTQQQSVVGADDSGLTSDNDWELVDDERIERAEESQYEPPAQYQQAVESFIEALHETPHSQHCQRTLANTAPYQCRPSAYSLPVVLSDCALLLAAVEELHEAVKHFFNVLCGLLDGSSHITPLPSTRAATSEPVAPPASSTLSASDRYATRNVLLSRLVDTQSLHALHQLVEAHTGTLLAADAEHLHMLLMPLLHSH